MGNCGFTLAPCRPGERHLVVRNLERAEDIPAEAMQAGIDWTWETYAQYLDAVDRWPKGINYAGYVGHSALRTYAMGERAFSEPATAEDLAVMKRELADALAAGAMGFTTSRTRNHETADRRPVASRVAEWSEVRELVQVMGDLGAGIFEIAGEDTGRDPDRQRDYLERLRDLAVETGRAGHVGHVQLALRAGRLARVLQPARRDRAGRRAHVRPGAQPRARASCCRSRPGCRSTSCPSGARCAGARSTSSARSCATPRCADGS